jgi:hypothetical protein
MSIETRLTCSFNFRDAPGPLTIPFALSWLPASASPAHKKPAIQSKSLVSGFHNVFFHPITLLIIRLQPEHLLTSPLLKGVGTFTEKDKWVGI